MTNNNTKLFGGLDANMLKLLAMIFMLIDHLWATIVPGNQWMNYVGRLAFPIFAFQIVEGFIHTSDFKRYARRLFIFALISEIPFNLFYGSSIIYPYYQNVMFTLLFGLLAIRALDKLRTDPNRKNTILAILALVFYPLLAMISITDYGAMGVLTVIVFYLFRDFPFSWLLQLISMILLNIVFFTGMYIPIEFFGHEFEFTSQGFAILSLPAIWLYNGKKGYKNPILQYGMYIFYPAHMLILYLIFSSM